MPFTSDKIPEITIKFYNEKIKPEAVIQFIASYQYVLKNNIIFEMESEEKKILVQPAKILYFTIHNFKMGNNTREVPILVQENIKSDYRTKDNLERKELSKFTKLLAKQNFAFDSYESNFKITEIQKVNEKVLFYCSYIDMFHLLNYDAIKGQISKILVELNQ